MTNKDQFFSLRLSDSIYYKEHFEKILAESTIVLPPKVSGALLGTMMQLACHSFITALKQTDLAAPELIAEAKKFNDNDLEDYLKRYKLGGYAPNADIASFKPGKN